MPAFVLGNGVSRAHISIDQLQKLGPVYACNAVYRTHTPTVLVATDRPIATEIQESGYSARNRFYTRRPMPGLGGHPVPRAYHGMSSGPIALAIAAEDGNNPMYLLGFDMGPDLTGRFNNLFADTEHYKRLGSQPTYTGNWIRQITQILGAFTDHSFIRVIGPTTAMITDLDRMPNLVNMPMVEFEALINKPKDLG